LIISSISTHTIFASSSYSSSSSSTKPSKQCEDASKKINKKAEATQSSGVCNMDITRDSPSMQLLGHKFNEFTPQEVRYGTVGNNNVLMVFEFTVLASEVNPVIKSFEDHGITVTATHNHWLFEHPTIYYIHAEKTGDLNTLLQDAKDALSKTSG
jgi:hypothetical protein